MEVIKKVCTRGCPGSVVLSEVQLIVFIQLIQIQFEYAQPCDIHCIRESGATLNHEKGFLKLKKGASRQSDSPLSVNFKIMKFIWKAHATRTPI